MENREQNIAEEPAQVPETAEAEQAAASEATEEAQGPREYAVVPATVVRLEEDAAVVSFGWTAEGRVSFAQFEKADGKPAVKVGDQFDVLIEALGEAPEQIVLSKEKAEKLATWDQVMSLGKGGQIRGTIAARIPGGFSVDIGMRGFLPSAQADVRRLGNPDALVGQTFDFTITELDKRRGNVVLSRRAILEKELAAKKEETLAKISEGAVLTGTVKTVTDYGAFVDLGGVDGLLHATEMSWGRMAHPREHVKTGKEVTVKVVKVDPNTGKIGLSLKALQPDPWTVVPKKYPARTEVTGKVVGFAEFGAFVELEPGIEGLVHVSEMSWQRVKHPSDAVKMGEEVKAVVLEADLAQRRLRLGMRQLQPNPWSSMLEKYPVGTKLKRTVRNVTDFGVFLGIEEGIDGLVHISELDWEGKVKHPGDLYKVGDEVEAVVLDIDVENERFSLSVKQLQADPWQAALEAHPVGSKLEGKVTRIADFGAFVEIAPGIEGLVHISQLREERVESVASVVSVGDVIEVKVIDIRPRERKVSLSVRALTEEGGGEDYREHLAEEGNARTTLGDVFGDKLRKLK